MPLIVRWYLRTALMMFLLALLVGFLQTLSGVFSFSTSGLVPVFFHLLMVGWVTQFILGIALWMLPKYSMEKPRANENLSWAAYILLNAGLLFRVISEPFHTISPEAIWGWLLVTSALLQWLAGCFYVFNAWRRVKVK